MMPGEEPVKVSSGMAISHKRQNACEDPTLEPCQVTLVSFGKKKKKKKKKKNLIVVFFFFAQDQCCPTGHTCCQVSGRGAGCAPPGGLCCTNSKVPGSGFPCAAGNTCCGNKCMPVGAVCCENVPGSEDSRYCLAGSTCSLETASCSSGATLFLSSALLALLAVVSVI
jgi:hypothetical protein